MQRAKMEVHAAFVDAPLMTTLVAVLDDPACADCEHEGLMWYALKLSCLLARADANTRTLLDVGGVGVTLSVLRSSWPVAHLEVALALLQNIAFTADGIAAILSADGVASVARIHATRRPWRRRRAGRGGGAWAAVDAVRAKRAGGEL